MIKKHKLSHKLIAYILLVCFFLQSCNSNLSQIKDKGKEKVESEDQAGIAQTSDNDLESYRNLLTLATNENDPEAQFLLGQRAYESWKKEGQREFAYKETIDWLEKAARQDHEAAIALLQELSQPSVALTLNKGKQKEPQEEKEARASKVIAIRQERKRKKLDKAVDQEEKEEGENNRRDLKLEEPPQHGLCPNLDQEAVGWYQKAIENTKKYSDFKEFIGQINTNKGRLKLSDLIVMDLHSEEIPECINWGGNSLIKGHTDQIFSPLFTSPNFKKYEDSIMFIDPSSTGPDETSYCVVRRSGNYYFITDLGGMAGGYETEEAKRDGGSKEVIKQLIQIAKNHQANIVVEINGNRSYVNLIKNKVAKDLKKEVKKEVKGRFGNKLEAKGKVKAEVKLLVEQEMLENTKMWTKVDYYYIRLNKEKKILSTLYPLLKNHQLIIDREAFRRDFESRPNNDLSYKFFYQLITLRRKDTTSKPGSHLTFTSKSFDQLVQILKNEKEDVISKSLNFNELVEKLAGHMDEFTSTPTISLDHDDRVDAVASAIFYLQDLQKRKEANSKKNEHTSLSGSIPTFLPYVKRPSFTISHLRNNSKQPRRTSTSNSKKQPAIRIDLKQGTISRPKQENKDN